MENRFSERHDVLIVLSALTEKPYMAESLSAIASSLFVAFPLEKENALDYNYFLFLWNSVLRKY